VAARLEQVTSVLESVYFLFLCSHSGSQAGGSHDRSRKRLFSAAGTYFPNKSSLSSDVVGDICDVVGDIC